MKSYRELAGIKSQQLNSKHPELRSPSNTAMGWGHTVLSMHACMFV